MLDVTMQKLVVMERNVKDEMITVFLKLIASCLQQENGSPSS
jgi:hypothetical protein